MQPKSALVAPEHLAAGNSSYSKPTSEQKLSSALAPAATKVNVESIFLGKKNPKQNKTNKKYKKTSKIYIQCRQIEVTLEEACFIRLVCLFFFFFLSLFRNLVRGAAAGSQKRYKSISREGHMIAWSAPKVISSWLKAPSNEWYHKNQEGEEGKWDRAQPHTVIMKDLGHVTERQKKRGILLPAWRIVLKVRRVWVKPRPGTEHPSGL